MTLNPDPAVPPIDVAAALAKLEAAFAVLLASQARMNSQLDALTNRLGDARIVPREVRIKGTGIVLELEP